MDHARTLPAPVAGKPLIWDWLFLLLLAGCIAGSAWVGSLAYREGMKTEATKRTGEAWLEWFAQSATTRSSEAAPEAACAARPQAVWSVCQSWLLGPDGPFGAQRNAYTGEPIRVVQACSGSDRTLAGMVALDKVTTLPPGSAVPIVVAPLAPDDSIAQKITVRVTVCGPDAGPIRVGEIEF